MPQKRNKFIVLGFVIILGGAIYFLGSNQYKINKPIKECETFLSKNQYREGLAFFPPPAVNCIKNRNKVTLIEADKIENELKEIKPDEQLIKSINLQKALEIYKEIEQLRSAQSFQVPQYFQICVLTSFNEQNNYTIYPTVFNQSHSHNELYNFHCSSQLEYIKLSNINIFIQQVKDSDYSEFFTYFYLVPNEIKNTLVSAEEFSQNINKYSLIFQF